MPIGTDIGAMINAYLEGTRDQLNSAMADTGVVRVSRTVIPAGGGRWRVGADLDESSLASIQDNGVTVTVVHTAADLGALGGARAAGKPDYPTAEEIRTRLRQLMNQRTVSCSIGDLQSARGKDKDGNDVEQPVQYLKIEQPDATKQCLITAGIHAREWAPPTAVLTCFEQLIAAYPSHSVRCGKLTIGSESVKAIIDNLVIYVAPMLNPLGYDYSRNVDKWWRKNRVAAPPPESVRKGCKDRDQTGVDINRNSDIAWDFETYYDPEALEKRSVQELRINASKLPCDEVFIGTKPFSERETQNVDALIQKGIKSFLDVHSVGPEILFPWGMEEDQNTRPDENYKATGFDKKRGSKNFEYGEYIDAGLQTAMREISILMRKAIQSAVGVNYLVDFAAHKPKNLRDNYYATGMVTDYAFSQGVPVSLIMECGSEPEGYFFPRYNKDFPKIEIAIHAAILRFLQKIATGV